MSVLEHSRAMWNRETYRHEDTTYANIRTQPLAYPRALPEDAHQAVQFNVSMSSRSAVPLYLLSLVLSSRAENQEPWLKRGRAKRNSPILVPVEDRGEDLMYVCRSADKEDDD